MPIGYNESTWLTSYQVRSFSIKPFEITEVQDLMAISPQILTQHLDRMRQQTVNYINVQFQAGRQHITWQTPPTDNAWQLASALQAIPAAKYNIQIAEVQEPVHRRSRYELLLDPSNSF